MSHATTMVTPHYHLPGHLLNKTDLELLSLALRNTATSSFTSMSSEQGGTSSRTRFWRDLSLAELTKQRKSPPTVFEGAWLIGLPQSRCRWQDSFLVCLQKFWEERRHLRDGVNSQMKAMKMSWTGHSVSLCPGGHQSVPRRMSRRNCIIF